MGKYDGILIMSDYDGTLTSRASTVSEENRRAVEYFQSEGGIFSIASGRLGEFVAEIGRQVPLNGYSVVINGTLICEPDAKKYLYEHPLDREKMIGFAKKICNACPKRDHMRFVTKEDTYHIKPDTDIEEVLKDKEGPFYKFLCVTPAEHSDEYFAKIREQAGEDFYVSRSWVNGIEIQPAGTTKGDAIARLKELYGGRVHTVIAVGDYENDIDMIKKADIGYAVANAVPALKAVADRITVSCTEHAIAAIINEI